MFRLPPKDRELSPFTGLTRAHWEAVADHWLLSARDWASERHAGILPPGGQSSGSGSRSDSLEGFARSFLAAAARIAGSRGTDPHDHAGWYAEGLDHGTRAGGPEEWGRAVSREHFPSGLCQPIVEASAIAFGLALSRPWLWDRLDPGVQDRLASWLAHHAQLRAWDNNWLLFTAITEAFLTSVGVDVPGGHAADDVDRVESWYLGDGWYNDGDPRSGRNVDHYNSWVIHPYLWMWYQLRHELSPDARRERFRARLAEFADSYARLFAADGAPLFQGRSLVYRTAVLAGPWAAGLEGVGSLRPGAVRRLASGNLNYFLAGGTSSPLGLGWFGDEYRPMLQPYSGPGSPYWAGIGFLGLAAPAGHALWTEPEEPQPSDREPAVTTWPGVGWVIQHNADGIVRIANHGSDHAVPGRAGTPDFYAPFYSKLAYSSHASPGLGPAWRDGIDDHLALVDEWGRSTRRGWIRDVATGEGWAASWHVPEVAGQFLPGARVVSASAMGDGVEVRCHLVTCPDRWTAREGGAATPPGLVSTLIPLAGWGDANVQVADYEGSTPWGGPVRVPYLTVTPGPAATVVLVTLHALARRLDAAWKPPVRASVRQAVVTLDWISGRTDTIDLAALFSQNDTGED